MFKHLALVSTILGEASQNSTVKLESKRPFQTLLEVKQSDSFK